MNKKQKILTLVALAVFIGLIVVDPFGHGPYYALDPHGIITHRLRFTTPRVERQISGATWTYGGDLNDSGIALVVLAIVYTGLLFVLGDKRNKGS